jgi:hypothetical protein
MPDAIKMPHISAVFFIIDPVVKHFQPIRNPLQRSGQSLSCHDKSLPTDNNSFDKIKQSNRDTQQYTPKNRPNYGCCNNRKQKILTGMTFGFNGCHFYTPLYPRLKLSKFMILGRPQGIMFIDHNVSPYGSRHNR